MAGLEVVMLKESTTNYRYTYIYLNNYFLHYGRWYLCRSNFDNWFRRFAWLGELHGNYNERNYSDST